MPKPRQLVSEDDSAYQVRCDAWVDLVAGGVARGLFGIALAEWVRIQQLDASRSRLQQLGRQLELEELPAAIAT